MMILCNGDLRMEGRGTTSTIDRCVLMHSAADGREASGGLSPYTARMNGIAPEPRVIAVDNGIPVYENTPRTSEYRLPAFALGNNELGPEDFLSPDAAQALGIAPQRPYQHQMYQK